MGKFILALVFLMCFSVSVYSDIIGEINTITNGIMQGLQTIAGSISTNSSSTMSFVTGAGNDTPVSTFNIFGINVGIGLSINTNLIGLATNSSAFINNITGDLNNTNFQGAFSEIALAESAIPCPYENVSFKFMAPGLPMDTGFRFGFIPPYVYNSTFSGNSALIGTSGIIHFGGEVRYRIWELDSGLLRVDARGSVDYDAGNLFAVANLVEPVVDTTNNMTINITNSWGGASFGLKLMGGLNIPIAGSIYCGIGMNFNVGSSTANAAVDDNITLGLPVQGLPTQLLSTHIAFSSGNIVTSYSAFDMRAIAGIQVLFINISGEYDLFNGDIALNIMPISIPF